MKPYPFVGLNHLTVPVATARSIECWPGQIAGRSNLPLRVSCRRCPLLAHSRHQLLRCTCPLLGAKQTWPIALQMSAGGAFFIERTRLRLMGVRTNLCSYVRAPANGYRSVQQL